MVRALILSAACLMAMPAFAQDAAGSGAAPAKAASPADSVASIVNSEFPAYDGNSDGQLDKAEFARWMVALKDQEMKATGSKLAPAEITAWADGAFSTADADKSAAVSKPELITYLTQGAG